MILCLVSPGALRANMTKKKTQIVIYNMVMYFSFLFTVVEGVTVYG